MSTEVTGLVTSTDVDRGIVFTLHICKETHFPQTPVSVDRKGFWVKRSFSK